MPLAARPGLRENGTDPAGESLDMPFRPLLAPLLAALLAFVFASQPRPAQAQGGGAGGFTPAQRQEIIGILREALRQDPSILREAVAAMDAAAQRDREGQARDAIARHREALERDTADPVRGAAAGAVTLVEFFDARCH